MMEEPSFVARMGRSDPGFLATEWRRVPSCRSPLVRQFHETARIPEVLRRVAPAGWDMPGRARSLERCRGKQARFHAEGAEMARRAAEKARLWRFAQESDQTPREAPESWLLRGPPRHLRALRVEPCLLADRSKPTPSPTFKVARRIQRRRAGSGTGLSGVSSHGFSSMAPLCRTSRTLRVTRHRSCSIAVAASSVSITGGVCPVWRFTVPLMAPQSLYDRITER